MAYGSARELEYPLSLAHRLGYLDAESHAELNAKAEETGRLLAGLVRALRKREPP